MFRRVCVPVAAVVVTLLCAASPAGADVTVSPTTAEQGGGVDLTFTVQNDHQKAAITKVRLVLPPASPVAEVYPLSIPHWAPQMTVRKLNPPMQSSAHGGGLITQTTADISWTAVPGKAIPPGGKADLQVAMGPMPESAQFQVTLQPTYADGSTGPALSPVAIALTPPAPVGEAAPDESTGEAAAAAGQGRGMGFAGMAGWIAALLFATIGAVLLLRSRRAAAPPAAPQNRTSGSSGKPVTKPSPAAEPAAGAEPAAEPAAGAEPAAEPAAGAEPNEQPVQAATGGPSAEAAQVGSAGHDDGAAPEDDEESATEPRARVSAWSYRDGP